MSVIREPDILSLMRQVSTWTAIGGDSKVVIHHIGTLAAQFPGIVRFELIPDSPGNALPSQAYSTYDGAVKASPIYATAEVASAGQNWGRVRLQLDLELLPEVSPARLVQFLGQQIALVLHRSALRNENRRLRQEAQELKLDIAARKVTARATGILAEQHGIGYEEAETLLRLQAQRGKLPLMQLADALVTARRPSLTAPMQAWARTA